MTGYPWTSGQTLTAADLNAAFAKAFNSPLSITVAWPSGLAVTTGTYVFTGTAPYGFTINSLDASVGASGGTITVNVRNAGQSVGGLASVTVSSASKVNTPATNSNASVSAGAIVDVVVTVSSGSPAGAFLTLNGTRT